MKKAEGDIMKKTLIILFAGMIVLSLTACSQNKNETSIETNSMKEASTGEWNRAETPLIPNEVKQLLDKATGDILGETYTPIAYIGNQADSGTNHAILCKVTPVVPDALATYSIVILFEDLQGNVEITEVQNSDAEAPTKQEGVSGAWAEAESSAVTEEAKIALDKATEDLLGIEYSPVALLGIQVVAGTNYSLLCEVKATDPKAEPSYSVVVVYMDLEGNAEITDAYDFISNK